MRYGAVPVVTPTGGLLDTVRPYGRDEAPTGFVAEAIFTEAFARAVESAVELHKKSAAWSALRDRAMAQDFSGRARSAITC